MGVLPPLTGLRFDDLTSGFRYYGPRACSLLASEDATLLDYQDIGVLLLLRRANLRISEVSVLMNPRKSGASRIFFSWWTGRLVHGRDHAAVPCALDSEARATAMRSYHLTVIVMGLVLAIGILYLVRRDHLYIRQGLFWILVASASLLFGLWPYLIDTLGTALGIAYPPALLFLVAIVILIFKALFGDIELTRVRRDLRRLNQRIALLEAGTSRRCRARFPFDESRHRGDAARVTNNPHPRSANP
jgi:hypothetical protein